MPSLLVHGFTTPASNEQRTIALQNVSDDLEQVRDVMRKLEIPASSIGDVLQLYHAHLGAQIHMVEQRREEARQKKINAIMLVTEEDDNGGRRPRRRRHHPEGRDIYNLDDEDLDKLYRDVVTPVGIGG